MLPQIKLGHYMSFDVKALFTCIHQNFALECIKRFISNNPDILDRTRMNAIDIIDLAEICLKTVSSFWFHFIVWGYSTINCTNLLNTERITIYLYDWYSVKSDMICSFTRRVKPHLPSTTKIPLATIKMHIFLTKHSFN